MRQGPAVALKESPPLEAEAWEGGSLRPGQGSRAMLEEWWGLTEGINERTAKEERF